MEINNNEIVNYTYKKIVTADDVAKTENTGLSTVDNTKLLNEDVYDTVELNTAKTTVSLVNFAPDKESIGTLSLVNYAPDSENILQSGENAVIATYSISLGDIKKSETDRIKEILYRLNKNQTSTTTNKIYDVKIGVGGKTDYSTGLYGQHIANKDTSTARTCDNAYDLLLYAHTKIDDVNIKNGITRAQLIKLAQDDDFESANNNIFGKINLAFDTIDKDNDNEISYDELNSFVGELTNNISDFNDDVNTYSNNLQAAYESASDKIGFVWKYAKEYLEAMGMDAQIEAYNRLSSQGKIKSANLEGNVLGCYTSALSVNSTTSPIIIYWRGDDGAGLTLDSNTLAASKWYDIVSVLIHELTHASMALYFNENGTLNDSALTALVNAGLLNEEQKAQYIDNDNYYTDVALITLINQLTLECSAYQTNEDYLDSIGQGDFDVGENEVSTIKKHLDTHYNELETTDGEVLATGTAKCNPGYDEDWWITYKKQGEYWA